MSTKPDLYVVKNGKGNYLPDQYRSTAKLTINHNYLDKQFADYPVILQKIGDMVARGDFTLGEEVDRFEESFAKVVGADYAIGVGSGTDALFLSLKTLGIGPGDEVITTPFTFYATIGAIVTAGATPVFVDVGENYNIDHTLIEQVITDKTKAIMPVHWSGRPCDLEALRALCDKHELSLVQDACHGIEATLDGKHLVSYGDIACYSMHPLKNLNVWGDGGVITTNNPEVADHLSLIRNHGLVDRDTCVQFSYNSRLDTLQAVVANYLLDNRLNNITDTRIRNAQYYDQSLTGIDGVELIARDLRLKEVFHLYQFNADRRDEMLGFLVGRGVDAKVHYPLPMHLQPAAQDLGYQRGDFPVCERIAENTLSVPVHEFITHEQIDVVVNTIKEFYR